MGTGPLLCHPSATLVPLAGWCSPPATVHFPLSSCYLFPDKPCWYLTRWCLLARMHLYPLILEFCWGVAGQAVGDAAYNAHIPRNTLRAIYPARLMDTCLKTIIILANGEGTVTASWAFLSSCRVNSDLECFPAWTVWTVISLGEGSIDYVATWSLVTCEHSWTTTRQRAAMQSALQNSLHGKKPVVCTCNSALFCTKSLLLLFFLELVSSWWQTKPIFPPFHEASMSVDGGGCKLLLRFGAIDKIFLDALCTSESKVKGTFWEWLGDVCNLLEISTEG